MAEGMFNAWAPAGWAARSAGTDPAQQLRSEAIEALGEIGIDISRYVPKSLTDAVPPIPAVVIGLCAEEACPAVPGAPSLHWPLADPSGAGLDHFRRTRDQLADRIRSFIGRLPSVEP